jgi:hypothetical protein
MECFEFFCPALNLFKRWCAHPFSLARRSATVGLRAVHGTGRHIPPAFLPALLDWGKRHPEQHDTLRSTLGRRGLWLSQQNPYWSYLTPVETPEETFLTASGEARVAALHTLRQHDPHRARALLAESWAQETHADRAMFLATFELKLSMADEAFLEAALDDKRKEVRVVAADLLARLPESQLVQRMIARVQPLLRVSNGLLKTRVEISLPESCDKAMQRDGIEIKNVPYRMGEKAWWLQQMLGRVPPTLWGQPADLIPKAEPEWRDMLLNGWLEAALRYRDTDTAVSLMKFKLFASRELLPLLTEEQRLDVAKHFFQNGVTMTEPQHPGLLILSSGPITWDAMLEHRVLKSISNTVPAWADRSWHAASILSTLGTVLPPSLLDKVKAFAPSEPTHPLSSAYASFLNMLEFRKEMLDAVRTDAQGALP